MQTAPPRQRRAARLTDAQRYERFRQRHGRLTVVDSDRGVRELSKQILDIAPPEIGLDFETASNRGHGVLNGSMRLVQLSIPGARGTSRNAIVDCFHADPRPLIPVLRSEEIEKIIHHQRFEVSWARVHIGTNMRNVYDTCEAWRAIQRTLKELPDDIVQDILPGWEKHDNTLGTLIRLYLHMEIPKESQRSDWSNPRLNGDQWVYAAMDSAVMKPLADFTKDVAERLGLTQQIADKCAYMTRRIAGQARAKVVDGDDDRVRVEQSLRHARDIAELTGVWNFARQATLTAEARLTLKRLYQQRRRELRAGAPPLIIPHKPERYPPF